MRMFRFAIVPLLLTACGTVETASIAADKGTTAAALSTGQTYEIVSASTGQALDIVGISQDDGAQLQQYTYGAGRNQQWTLVPTDGGTFAVVSLNSNRVLDVPGASQTAGVIVWQWDFINGANQRWAFNQQSDGSYEIVNVNSGMCLNLINNLPTPGTRVQQWGCWGGINQHWQLVGIAATPVAQVSSSSTTTSTTSSPAPESQTTSTTPTATNTTFDFQAAGNDPYNISDYGSWLQNNKAHLQSALDAAGAGSGERMLVTAMAMLETTDMDPSQRDASKDGTPSMNLSILNLNLDMVQQLGYQGNAGGAALNDPANLSQAVALLLHGFRTWGVASTLNFQRGGSTAFADGVSYGAADYRNVIASMYGGIVADPTLLNDSRRVEIYLQHV